MARFPQRHPLLALLLLLALMPAIIGGSLTHACGCEGLIYVGGCRCYGDADPCAAGKVTEQTAVGSCRSGCCGGAVPSQHDTPTEPLDTPSDEEATIFLPTHRCDHVAYEMNSAMPRFELPAQPIALLPVAMAPDLCPHHPDPDTAPGPSGLPEPPLIPLRCEAHLLPLRL